MTQDQRPTPKLLLCPFCGCEPFGMENLEGRIRHFVCSKCECEGPMTDVGMGEGNATVLQRAIALWNTRTLRTLTPEQVERARRIIASVDDPLGMASPRTGRVAVDLLREVVGDE